jgi:hypothetical protein
MEQELNVGTIVVNSWGWEQTNVDFYQIVRKTPKSVWVKKLPATVEQNGFMSGMAMPTGEPVGEEIGPCRINKRGGISVSKYGGTSVWNGKPQYASWYA